MALETLKGVKRINAYEIIVMDELREQYPEKFNESGAMDYDWFEKEIRPTSFIYVRHDKNSISFTIQNGPIKENGINGCQVDTLIHVAKYIIEELNNKYPSKYNDAAIESLATAIWNLDKRTVDREERGVEGLDIL